MEEKLYSILRKHKLPLKKREELMVDLLTLFSVSKPFDALIDRLEIASNIKYPNRPYTPGFRKSVALMWKGKESELLMQVKKLEKEVNVC